MRFYTAFFVYLFISVSYADSETTEDLLKAPNILSYFTEKGHLIFEEPAGGDLVANPRGYFPKIDFFAIYEVKRKFSSLPKEHLDKFNFVTETLIGFPDIIWGFGELYKYGLDGTDKNTFLAGMYMQYSAFLGNPEYQEKLAQEFLSGEVFNKDSNAALTWALKSAEKKYWKGMLTASDILLADESIKSNARDTALWLHKLIEIEPQSELQRESNYWAMDILGSLYLQGKGVKKDVQKAVEFMTMSANGHNLSAMYRLGYIYYYGEHVTENYGTAAKWFLKSAKQGYPESQKALSYMYRHGQGVEKNLVKAFAWGLLATKNGQNVSDWGSLRSLMTSSQINQAQEMALLFEKMEGWVQKEFLVDGLNVTKKTKVSGTDCVKGEVFEFNIRGDIGPDSTFVLQKLFDESDTCITSKGEKIPVKVSLSSAGGLLSDGYMLGDFFRKRNVKTIVEAGNLCGSSCAIAFIGGKERVVEDGGSLIFHAPYTVDINESGDKVFKCIDDENSLEVLKDYFVVMTTSENGKRLFDRTMKYCNPQDGWNIDGINSAEIYGLSTSRD